MEFLRQLLEMAKKKGHVVPKASKKKKKDKEKPEINNFVAKHAQQMTGAGAHEEKSGKYAGRQRQKRQWKKEEGL